MIGNCRTIYLGVVIALIFFISFALLNSTDTLSHSTVPIV
jgi:hypothetical protein